MLSNILIFYNSSQLIYSSTQIIIRAVFVEKDVLECQKFRAIIGAYFMLIFLLFHSINIDNQGSYIKESELFSIICDNELAELFFIG